eukprot:scaffold40358_cov176-Amphora_coffeaeformis.AAC.2
MHDRRLAHKEDGALQDCRILHAECNTGDSSAIDRVLEHTERILEQPCNDAKLLRQVTAVVEHLCDENLNSRWSLDEASDAFSICSNSAAKRKDIEASNTACKTLPAQKTPKLDSPA